MVDLTQVSDNTTEIESRLDLLKDISPTTSSTLFNRTSLQIVHLCLPTESIDAHADDIQDFLVSGLCRRGVNDTQVEAAQRAFRKHMFGQYLNYVAEKLNGSKILKLAISYLLDRACRIYGSAIDGAFKDKLMEFVSLSTNESQHLHALDGGADPRQPMSERKQRDSERRGKAQQRGSHPRASIRDESTVRREAVSTPPNNRRRRKNRCRAEQGISAATCDRL